MSKRTSDELIELFLDRHFPLGGGDTVDNVRLDLEAISRCAEQSGFTDGYEACRQRILNDLMAHKE